MPIVARFQGVLITMEFKEDGTPRFRAICGAFNGVFDVQTLGMIEGDVPARAVQMVKDGAKRHNKDLIEVWKTRKCR